MIQKILITVCIALYAVGVPLLEINAAQAFNPDWTPQVGIHEVWQLFTNTAVGMLCLWWLWVHHQVILSATLSLIVTGSFLAAFLTQDFYGGSIRYLDASETTLLDFNIGVVGFGIAFILLLNAVLVETIQALDFHMDDLSLPSAALHDLM